MILYSYVYSQPWLSNQTGSTNPPTFLAYSRTRVHTRVLTVLQPRFRASPIHTVQYKLYGFFLLMFKYGKPSVQLFKSKIGNTNTGWQIYFGMLMY